MGTINIPGLGNVEITGDVPDDAEAEVILREVNRLEDERIRNAPFVPIPKPLTQGVTAGVPAFEKGPLGIVPPQIRQRVRSAVEASPGLFEALGLPARPGGTDAVDVAEGALQFGLEAGPSIAGTVKGAALGTAVTGNPLGTIGGAIVGGVGAEALAQEVGLAPASKTNLALTGAAPGVGPVVGVASRLGGKVVGGAVGLLPPARAVQARQTLEEGREFLSSIGGEILTRVKGGADKVPGVGKVRVRSAGELFDAARASGVLITPAQLPKTGEAIETMIKELDALSPIPEVAQAIAILKKQQQILFSGGPVDFKNFIEAKKAVGAAVGRAEKQGGVKLGASKKLFREMVDDLDNLAKAAPTKRAARLAQAATKRAKLEFAVRDMERVFADTIKQAEAGEGFVINVVQAAKKIAQKTNPKSKFFDKNFASALGGDLPEIQRTLTKLAEAAGKTGATGPGSLVVRTRTAKAGSTVVGALIGESAFGGLGAATGAVIGASGPELMVSALSTPTGRKILEAASRLGKGRISTRAWILAAVVGMRAAGVGEDQIDEFVSEQEEPAPAESPPGVQDIPEQEEPPVEEPPTPEVERAHSRLLESLQGVLDGG